VGIRPSKASGQVRDDKLASSMPTCGEIVKEITMKPCRRQFLHLTRTTLARA
jgi:hypothetical protein